MFGLFMCSVSGVSYMFGVISPSLKDSMDYSQTEINMVGTMANIGGNLGLIGSLFYNYFGTRPSCILAGLLIFSGYFLIYCSAMKWIWGNYILMGLFFMTMQNGTSTSYTTALSTNIMNFSQRSRGLVVGTMAACIAISSALFTGIYSFIFKKNLNPFLLFMAICAGSVPLVATIFMNVINDPKEQQVKSDESLVINQDNADMDLESLTIVENLSPTYGTEDLSKQKANLIKNASKSTHEQIFQEVHTIHMLLTLDFWLLFIVFFSGVGSTYVIINNLGAIVLSLGAQDGAQNALVILFSLFNFAGRIITGILSDLLARHVNRITFLNTAVLCIGLVHYGFSFASIPMMYPLIIFLGLVYGALYSMIPAFLSDRFGQKYFSINFSVACLAPSCGSYLLATLLAGAIYDLNSKGSSKRCFGRRCYQMTYLICTAICIFAFIIGLFLMYRSRRMYHRMNAHNNNRRQLTKA